MAWDVRNATKGRPRLNTTVGSLVEVQDGAVDQVDVRRVEQPCAEPAAQASPRKRMQLRISERRVALALGDVLASAASVAIALYIWAYVAHRQFDEQYVMRHVYWFLILPLMWYVLASANDYYNLRVAARVRSSLARLARVMLELLLAYLLIFFISPRDALPRLFIVYYAVISLVLIGIWRGWRLFLVGWTEFRRRALIVGAGPAARLICQAIEQEAHADYDIVGCVVSAEDQDPDFDAARVLGTAASLPMLVTAHGVSELIVTYLNVVPADVFQGVMASYEQGVVVMPMPILYEQITGRVPVEHVGEHLWPLVLPYEGATLAFNAYRLIKRMMDIIASLCGLAIFLPLLPFLAVAIKLDSRGPVFYRQPRLGRGGRVFTIVKLRSMRVNAEEDGSPRWATSRDPRVTRVGRFLRKTRIDEVPQLVNVLMGQMTVVGPRPERPAFVEMLAKEIPFYRSRLVVKPGLTGWAQVCYPYGSSTEDALRKLQYDLFYIRHQSLMRDLLIMVRTVGTMMTLRGT